MSLPVPETTLPIDNPASAKSSSTVSGDQIKPEDASSTGGISRSSDDPASSTQLSSLQKLLKASLRQFPDFPSPGILFEDILPIFANPALHNTLISALHQHILQSFPSKSPNSHGIDVVVGLEARGFLFGPSLALRLGAGFVPVRKSGKLPGPTLTETYEKEYGQDHFQIQADAIKPNQKVLIVDDIIATGGSAAAAGSLVQKLGANLLGFVFIMELDFLKGRDKLPAPTFTLLASQF